MGAQLSQAVGKSGNMSDRTHIWEVLLSVPINPVLGTGYQSFWLGPRVPWIWARLDGDTVLEAHNGYLQIYLDLGLIGLFIISTFLIATYHKICKRLKPLTNLASLSLGLWTLLLFYNVSEASLEINLLFVTFLLAAIPLSERAVSRVPSAQPLDRSFTAQWPAVRSELEGQATFLSTGGDNYRRIGETSRHLQLYRKRVHLARPLPL